MRNINVSDGRLDSKPLLAGIFGHQIQYSLSPLLHNSMARISGARLCYGSFDVPPDKFAAAFAGFKAMGIKGANITKPYKTEVLQYLDSINGDAAIIKAVNTVNLEKNGTYAGYNTDINGFIKAADYEFNEKFAGKRVVLLGAGGASRGVLYALIKEGAGEVLIINRDESKADLIAKEASSWNGNAGGGTHVASSGFSCGSYANGFIKDGFDIIINTITPSEESARSIKDFVTSAGRSISRISVMDISYSVDSSCLFSASGHIPLKYAGGLSMLIFQAIESFRIWTGESVNPDILSKAMHGSA